MKHGIIKMMLLLAAAYTNTPIFSQDANTAVGTPNGTFEVSNMGAAQYHIQIEVPDGGPLKPDIGIDYNSQSGLGNVGWGCNISGISAITRGVKDIFHDYVVVGLRYENNDAYYLDGKRLLLKSGADGSLGSVYHPDGDPFTDVTIKNGIYGIYFEVKTPDGMTTIYGNSDNSCIRFTSGGVQYVASWNVYSRTNATGQTIHYSYNTSNYYPCVSQIRYDLQDGTQNTINFTYSSLGGAVQKFRLKGVEGRIDKLLTKITCKTGNDVFRNYHFIYNKTSDGTAIKFPRLTKIKVTGADGSSLPPIALTWNYLPNFVSFNSEEPHFSTNNPTGTQITDKKFLAHDMNGDGIDDIIQISIDSKSYKKKSFIHLLQTYRNSFNQIEYYPTQLYSIPYDFFNEKRGFGSQKSFHFGDFDGDGYADLLMPYLVISPSGSDVFIQTFYGSKERLDTMQAGPDHGLLLQQSTNSLPPYTVVDINNDGISEIFVLESGSSTFRPGHIFTIGQDRTFSKETVYLSLPSNPQKLFAADFNGDGLQDLLVVCSSGYKIFWNRGGYRYQATAPSINTHFSNNNTVAGTDIKDMQTIQLGDFDGDGLPDLLLNEYNNSRYHFALNNGNGTFTHTDDVQIDLFNDAKDNDDDKFTVIVNDFDYDGKSDVFIAHAHYEYHGWFHSTTYEYTDVQWHRSTGTSLSLMKSVRTKNKLDAQNGHITLGDIDGDGRLELINYGSDLTTSATAERTIKPRFYSDNMAVSSAKVSSITDGFGNKTQINYASLTNPPVYTKGTGCTYPLVDLQTPLHVVSSLKTPVNATGSASSWMTQTYQYEGLKAHVAGRGLLGFAKMTVSDDVMGTTTVKEMSGWTAENWFTPTTIEEETTINGIDESQKKVITMSYSGGIYGHGFSYPSVVTTTGFDNHTTKTIYTYDINKGMPTQEKTIYDGGTNTNYIQISYIYGAAKYGGRWLPIEIVRTQKHPDDNASHSSKTTYTYTPKGNVASITTNSGTPMALKTEYTYDTYGNVTSSVSSEQVVNSVKTLITYDATGRFVTKTRTLPASAVKTYTYDIWGNMLTECDETDASNKLTTTYTYDGWGRLKSKTSPEGLCKNYETGWASGSSKKYFTKETGTAMPPLTIYYDAFGRELQRKTKGPQNIDVTRTTSYNRMGQVTQVKNVTGKLTLTDKYTYDMRGRVLTESSSTGKSTTYSYDKRSITTTTAGRTYTQTTDAWGNIVTSTDPAGNEVSYTYYSNGKPSSVTTNGTTVSMTYDVAGNQTSLTDPDAGTSTYTYSADGILLTQTDGRGVETKFFYDDLGRIKSKQVGMSTINYTYGTTGVETLRLTKETLDDKTVKYTHDEFGRVLTETRIVGDKGTYTFTHSYNDQNQLSQTIYPGGLTVTYQYDENGYKTQTQAGTAVVYQQTGFNGLVSSSSFMGKLTSTSTRNTRGYLQNLKITSESSVLEQFNTQYEISTGNLLSRQRKGTSKETFAYDNLDRLVSVKVGSKETMRMDYADNGNILYKTGIGEYEYNAYDHPHAVTDVENVDMNFPTNRRLSTTFNDFGKIETIIDCVHKPSGQSGRRILPVIPNAIMSFEYGPHQERWYSKLTLRNKLSLTTIYAGDYEKITDYSSGEARVREFYYLDGNAIVIKENGEFKNFLAFTDNIGSILSVIDAEGRSVFDASYDAWGRQTVTKNEIGLRRGYTGHEMLNEFGIINMNGRLYDPLLGRFFSPDNYVQMPDNSQSFNRYSYCLNNPLKYVDPSGEIWWIPVVIGAYLGGSSVNGTLNPFKWDYGNWQTYAGMAVGGVSGYAGATIAASGIPLANTAGIAASSLINSVGNHVITGGQTPISISFGAFSYDFTNGSFGYLGKKGNSTLENVGYFLGALANTSDILAGMKPGEVTLRTENNPDYSTKGDPIGHSQITKGDKVLIDWGPTEEKASLFGLLDATNSYENGVLIPNQKGSSFWNPIEIKGVNVNRILKFSDYLNKGGKYNLLYNNCVSMTSRALNMSGVFNIGIHPYILHTQMYLRSIGIRPMLYSHFLLNR